MEKFVCKAEIVEEAGYKAALRGLGFNKKQEKDMAPVAEKLCDKDFGHNKFLESIIIWVEVTVPRYVWQEMDTFRLSTKQSESTMHTLIKEIGEGVDLDAFEEGSISQEQLKLLESSLRLEDPIDRLVRAKKLLPEGFLQRRLWCMSYKTLRNICIQRRTHRLPHWKSFLEQVYSQLEHPELLPPIKKDKEKPLRQVKFRFKKDDDGHNYLVPDKYCEQFDILLDAACESIDAETEFGNFCAQYRIDGISGYTFTQPQYM